MRLIYAAAQEGVPTAFLQWHQGARGRGAQIVLLHLVSAYIPRIGILASPWDNNSFTLKWDIAYETTACANFPLESLHHIKSTVHVLMDLAIDSTQEANPDTDLLEPFSPSDSTI